MKHNPQVGRRPAMMALAITATVTLVASVASTGVQAAPPGSAEKSLYIIQTVSDPLAGYDGGVSGYARTSPAAGKRLDAHSNAAKRWSAKLNSEHDAALRTARVSTDRKVYDYNVAFNGFAAELTAAEAQRLQNTKSVLRVWKNEILQADTTTTRDFLGLSGKNGVWKKQFSSDARAGEGVIVGIIDTGLWAENPAFAALSEPRPDQAVIDTKWNGVCDDGLEQPISCNNKVIGARWYNESGAGDDAIEFMSARDYNGHGSHTASTAAGNGNVPASINGFDVGKTSGVAPAARLAIYKTLWEQADGTGSGGSVDLVAAIDDAVADGVDVINYSISGSRLYVVDPVEIAFLFAADAGVFVSTSAGNSGDTVGTSSVAHNSPWTMTVAASTHDRGNQKTVTLGSGQSYTGVGVVPPGLASSPIVDSTAIAAGDVSAAQLCLPGSLNPAGASGKIVICTRGVNARVEKSQTVQLAGGVGMILVNTSDAQSINGDWHYVPSVHVGPTAGTAIKAYAATAGATAALSVTNTAKVTAPEMAGFSSYGPALAGAGDLLKPDITAPGVDVIAAVAPPGNDGKDFDAYSGTSMSAPHIAGIAALIKSKNPTWSPIWIKSAIMTTANTKDTAGKTIQWSQGNATPLNFGSGHVVPAKAFDPGLVYDSGFIEWLQYSCGIGQLQLISTACGSVGSIDPSDLNYPSISIGDLPGAQSVTRTVTNVTKKTSVYIPSVKAPAGTKVKVSPQLLIIKPGQSKSYTVTITRTTAPIGQWAFGSVTLTEFGTGKHKVTSPIAVRPVQFAAPTEVSGSGATGSTAISAKVGYSGTLNSAVNGLAAAAVTNLAFPSANTAFEPIESDHVKKVTVTVPAGSKLARFATFDADLPAGTDLDLYAYQGGDEIAVSAGGTSEESITLTEPGTYDIYVHMYAFTAPAPVTVAHHAFVVPGSAAGNLTATPASQSVTTGSTPTVTLNWTGLAAGRYLGVVVFTDGTTTVGQTVVSITN